VDPYNHPALKIRDHSCCFAIKKPMDGKKSDWITTAEGRGWTAKAGQQRIK